MARPRSRPPWSGSELAATCSLAVWGSGVRVPSAPQVSSRENASHSIDGSRGVSCLGSPWGHGVCQLLIRDFVRVCRRLSPSAILTSYLAACALVPLPSQLLVAWGAAV